MRFKLIIDKEKEEEIVARVHSASDLTREIENLVLSYSGVDEMCVQGDYELLRIKSGKSYRTAGTLTEIEKTLPSYFVRINKSSIANERRISCFKTTFSGGVDAIFKCGHKDYVSRRCFAEIKKRYKL